MIRHPLHDGLVQCWRTPSSTTRRNQCTLNAAYCQITLDACYGWYSRILSSFTHTYTHTHTHTHTLVQLHNSMALRPTHLIHHAHLDIITSIVPVLVIIIHLSAALNHLFIICSIRALAVCLARFSVIYALARSTAWQLCLHSRLLRTGEMFGIPPYRKSYCASFL